MSTSKISKLSDLETWSSMHGKLVTNLRKNYTQDSCCITLCRDIFQKNHSDSQKKGRMANIAQTNYIVHHVYNINTFIKNSNWNQKTTQRFFTIHSGNPPKSKKKRPATPYSRWSTSHLCLELPPPQALRQRTAGILRSPRFQGDKNGKSWLGWKKWGFP